MPQLVLDTRLKMQLSVKRAATMTRSLADLGPGEEATLESVDLEDDLAVRLMELGFVPGVTVVPGCSAPGGDPRVFRVDGSEIALRRETYQRLKIRFR